MKKLKKLISLTEAAKLSEYNQDYLGSLIRKGEIKAQKIGRGYFTTEKEIKNFLTRQKRNKRKLAVKNFFLHRGISIIFVYTSVALIGIFSLGFLIFGNYNKLSSFASSGINSISSGLNSFFDQIQTNARKILATSGGPESQVSSAILAFDSNILDPGSPNTPWGGCGPLDAYCYIAKKISEPKTSKASTSVIKTAPTQISSRISNQALLAALRNLLTSDIPADILLKLRGPAGPTGPKGDAGISTTISSSYTPLPAIYMAGGVIPPNPVTSYSGGTFFNTTDLSSKNFITTNADISTLNVGGSGGIGGTLNVSGTFSTSGSASLATGENTTNTFGSGASSVNTIGSLTTPGALTLHGATTLDNSFSQTGANTFSTGTGNISLNGAVTVTGANIFNTGTGTVTLNNVSTNLTATDPIIDTTSASTLFINSVTNRPVSFGTGLVTANNFGSSSVAITGGAITGTTINNSTIGVTTPVAGNFTTIGVTTPGSAAFTTITNSGNVTLATGADTTNTFGSGASSINTIGSTITPGTLTLHGATTLDNSFSQTGANTFNTGTGAVSLNGDTTLATDKNFTQNGAGTFSTGTGAVSLNGNTTLATDKNFTQNGAGTFTTGSGAITLNGNVSLGEGKSLNTSGQVVLNYIPTSTTDYTIAIKPKAINPTNRYLYSGSYTDTGIMMGATSDYKYFGHATKFTGVYLAFSTPGVGYNLVLEYSKGAGVWGTISSFSDDTTNFSTNGSLFFAPPSDWATDTVNGATDYWVRVSTNTNPTTTAIGSTNNILPAGYAIAAYLSPTDIVPKFYVDYRGNVQVTTLLIAQDLSVTRNVASDLVPDANNTRALGSASKYWNTAYVNTVNANNIIATATEIGGTKSETFTLNSDNSPANPDQSLVFSRTASPNPVLGWSETNGTFTLNGPLVFTSGTGTASISLPGDVNSTSGGFKTNSITRLDNAGNLQNIGSYTSSVTPAGSTAVDLIGGTLTNNTTSGNQTLLSLTNAGTGTTEKGIYLNNTGTGTNAIEVAGTWTNGLIISSGNVGIGTTAPTRTLDVVGTGAISTSLAIGGATIGTNALAVTGTTNISGATTFGEQILLSNGTVTAPALAYASATNTGFRKETSGYGTVFVDRGVNVAVIQQGRLTAAVDSAISWAPGVNIEATPDLSLYRDTSNVLAQRNSANAQTFRLYRTYTDANNYERTAFQTTASTNFQILAEAAGTGITGDIYITPGNVLNVGSAGSPTRFQFNAADNTWANTLGDLKIKTTTNNELSFYTNNSERARITGAGFLGIGTTAPSELLHLTSATAAKPVLLIENTNADENNPELQFYKNTASPASNDSTGALNFYSNNSIGTKKRFGQIRNIINTTTDGAEQSEMIFRNYVDGTETIVMDIKGSYVGIGTTSPSTILHLSSSSPIITFTDTTFTRAATIENADGTLNLTANATGPNISIANSNGNVNFNSGDVFFENSSGNVGIGTTAPFQSFGSVLNLNGGGLHIKNSGNARIGIEGLNVAVLNLGVDNGAIDKKVTAIYSDNAAKIYFMGTSDTGIDRSATMTVDTYSGNIGIGTTNPTNMLSLGNGADRKFWIENTATDVVGRALTVAAGSTVAGTVVSDVAGGNLILQAGLGTGTGASTISFQTGTTLTTGTTLQTMSTKMTILGNGNVGIGTTAPRTLLDVATDGGQVRIGTTYGILGVGGNPVMIGGGRTEVALVHGSLTPLLHFINNQNSTSSVVGSIVGFNQGTQITGISMVSDGAVNSGNLQFSTANAGSLTEKMRIDKAGNVGIGITAPTAVLHLKAGTATASTAPLKFTSGTLLTAPEAGAIEFLTDAYYGTITTGAARKTFAFLESPTFTTPILGVASGTSLALGGATIGTNKLAVTGTSLFTGAVSVFEGATEVISLTSGSANGNLWVRGASGRLLLRGDNTTLEFGAAGDVIVQRDGAANTLAMRNSTASQALRLYNTYTDASNYERLAIAGVASSAFTITSEAAGTGTVRNIALMGGNVGIGTTAPSSKLTLGSGQLELPVGSVSAPSLTFSGNLNYGFYLSGASPTIVRNGVDQISFSGTDTYIIPTTVRIGPYSATDNSATTSTIYASQSSGAGNNGAKLALSGGAPGAGGSYGNLFLQPNGGNVGIGTTSPTNLLSLSGTAARTIWMERNTTAATAGQGLTLSSGGAIAGTADLAGGDLTLKSGISTGTGTSALHFYTATAGTTGTTDNTPTEKMTILGSGNVGIGTTAPAQSLEIYKAAATSSLRISMDASQYSGLEFFRAGSQVGTLFLDNSATGGVMSLWTNSTSRLALGANATETVSIINGGKVGIGTTAPSFKLDIQGTPAANSVFLYSNGGARFDSGNGAGLQNIVEIKGTPAVLRLSSYSGGSVYYTDWETLKSGTRKVMTLADPDGNNNADLSVPGNAYFATNNGNVGIGTTVPGTKLDVAGTARLGSSTLSEAFQFGSLGTNSPAIANANVTMSASNYAFSTDGTSQTIVNGVTNIDLRISNSIVGKFTATNGYFNGSGNYGIGTTNPTNLLSLSGTAARTIWMERNTTAATAGQGLTLSSGGAIAGTADLAGGDLTLKSGISTGTGTSALHFYTATAGTTGTTDNTPTEKMTILGSGNVGIGTTSPGYKLEVNGTGYFGGALTVAGGITATGNLLPSADNTYDLGSTTARWKTLHVGPGSVVVHNDATNTLKTTLGFSGTIAQLITDAATPLQITTGANVGMYMTTAGNVGIGTTAPGSKLEIITTNTLGATFTGTTAGDGIRVTQSNYSADNYVSLIEGNYDDGGGTDAAVRIGAMYNGGGSNLAFGTSNDYAGGITNTALFINNGGNIGIGTTAPKSKLSLLSGSAYTDGIFIGDISGIAGLDMWYSNAGSTSSYIESRYNDNASAIYFRTKAAGTPVNAMTILGTGNVGIGTTNPAYKLDVSGPTNLAVTGAGELLTDGNMETNPTVNWATYVDGGGGLTKAVESTIKHADAQSLKVTTNDAWGGLIYQSKTAVVGKRYTATGWLYRPSASGNSCAFQVGNTTSNTTDRYKYTNQAVSGVDAWERKTVSFVSSDTTLYVFGYMSNNQASTSCYFDDFSLVEESGNITMDGNVGIGTTSPSKKLTVLGIAGDTSVVSIATTGGNTCTFTTTGGTFSCASDVRLKHDIVSIVGADALSKINKLNPVNFHYNWQSDGDALVPGFIAQDFEKVFPDLVSVDPSTGYKSLSYAQLMPYAIEAIKELDLKINDLGIKIGSPSSSLGQYASDFFNVVLTKVEGTVAYMKALVLDSLKVGSPTKRTGITLYDEISGDPYCISVANGTTKTTPGECVVVEITPSASSNTSSTSTSGDTTPPVITLNGEAVINLAVGATYIEAGATATDNVDTEVAIIMSGSVDTSKIGINTITYSAKDTAGNSATPITRTVNVGDVSTLTPPPTEPALSTTTTTTTTDTTTTTAPTNTTTTTTPTDTTTTTTTDTTTTTAPAPTP